MFAKTVSSFSLAGGLLVLAGCTTMDESHLASSLMNADKSLSDQRASGIAQYSMLEPIPVSLNSLLGLPSPMTSGPTTSHTIYCY